VEKKRNEEKKKKVRVYLIEEKRVEK